MIALRGSLFCGKMKMVIKSRSQVLQDHDASRKNSGKEWSIAGSRAKMRKPKLDERTEDETLKQEGAGWNLAKDFF